MSEALSLDFPNSHKFTTETQNPWESLQYVEVEMPSEDESIARLKNIVAAEKQRFQSIATERCGDKTSTITSNSLEVPQNEYIPSDDEVEASYRIFTDAQLDLLSNEDQRDASSKRAAAEEFADSLDPFALSVVVASEVIAVSSSLNQLSRINGKRESRGSTTEWIKGWIDDRRDTREAIDKLKQCGYNEDGEQTEVFSLIMQQAKAIHYGIPTKRIRTDKELGHKRACDFKETMLLLEDSEHGDACRRALKEAGYKKLPENWDDQNFNTSDIAEMCRVAKSCK